MMKNEQENSTLETTIPLEIYAFHLKIINGISFTQRQIDIIAFILSGRSGKKIASLLSIAPKTVENHIQKITEKLESRTQESIIDFIEKSGKYSLLKEYYSSLLIQLTFEEELKKISKLINDRSIHIRLFHQEQNEKLPFFEQLKKHLKLLRIKTSLQFIDSSKPISNVLESPSTNFTVYCLNKEFSNTIQLTSLNPNNNSIILLGKNENSSTLTQLLNPPDFNLKQNTNYYFFIFEILKKMLPTISFDNCITIYQKQREVFQDSLSSQRPQKTNLLTKKKITPQINYKKTSILFMVCIFLVCFLFFIKNTEQTGKTLTWNLPKQTQIFIGREKLLEELDYQLHKNKKSDINTLAINACSGLGGVGKTQLVLQYLHHTKRPYTLKAWFPSENIKNLHTLYLEFAISLGYNDEKPTNENVIIYIKKWLREHPGWLIVYDNVNNFNDIQPLLPEQGGHVILTTRQRQWPATFKTLSVDIMSEKESIETVRSITKRNIENELPATKELVKILGYLPLALAQASAYIQQNHISISEYLKLYKKYEMEMLMDKTLPDGVDVNPVAITWNISLQAIVKETVIHNDQPIAIELLTVCSFLSPDKISRKTLLAWLQETHSELENPILILNKHLKLLWQYSMINLDDNHISVHRLVQVVLRDQLHHALKNKNAICSALDIKWYDSLLRFFINNENDFKLASSFDQLLEIRDKFKSKFSYTYNDELADLDLITCSVYFYQEKYDDYFKTLNYVNEYLKNKEGLDFLKTKLLYLYSAYYRKAKNFVESESKIDEALKIFENIKATQSIKEKDITNLKAKLLFNKANLYFAKNKSTKKLDMNTKEIEQAVKLINEAILIYHKNHNIRDWLRSVEVHGRILTLQNKGSDIINEFDKHANFFEETADARTKMLFYLTYSDAYLINKDFKKALHYCDKAKELAEKLSLATELKNIHTRENTIKKEL